MCIRLIFHRQNITIFFKYSEENYSLYLVFSWMPDVEDELTVDEDIPGVASAHGAQAEGQKEMVAGLHIGKYISNFRI